MQRALEGDFFSASFDFSFLEQAGWDFGTTDELETLFLDQGLFQDPVTVASSCASLRAILNATGDALSPMAFWLRYCVDGQVERAADVAAINSRLFCTWMEVCCRHLCGMGFCARGDGIVGCGQCSNRPGCCRFRRVAQFPGDDSSQETVQTWS